MTQNETQKLLDAQGLLDGLCAEGCRPSIRTIRRLTAEGKIPFMRLGGRIFFDIAQVRAALSKQPNAKV